MAYIINTSDTPAFRLGALTGTADAMVGSTAHDEETGDIYALISSGWVKVWDHETGTPDSAALPDGTTIIVSNGLEGAELVEVECTITDGKAVIPEGYTLAEAA